MWKEEKGDKKMGKLKAWASAITCDCQPINLMNDSNCFSVVTDYDGRFYAICQHCGKEIKLFDDPEPYFKKVKHHDIVYDTRIGYGTVDSYDHFMKTLVVNFNDNKHHTYDFNGHDYNENSDGIQYLAYETDTRKNNKKKQKRKERMNKTKIKREWLLEIIDIFENFLDEKNIKIDNPEKEGNEDEAIIFGSDCDHLEHDLIDLFELMGISVSVLIQGDGDETLGKNEN